MAVRHNTVSGRDILPTDYDDAHVFDGTPGMLLGADGVEVNPASLSVSADGLSALFTTISTIPDAATAFITSGYSTPGVGGARYIYDAAVDAAYVTAHPRAAKMIGARGFRLDPEQRLTIEMFGGDTCETNGVFTTWAVIGTPTDNFAPFNAYWNYAAVTSYGYKRVVGTLHFGVGYYYFSDTLQPYTQVDLVGVGADATSSNGTTFIFPPNKAGFVANTSGTGDEGTITGLSRGVGATGSRISGIYFASQGGTSNPLAHGLWVRTSIRVTDCVFDNFNGAGTRILAYSGAGGVNEGNANESYFLNCAYRANRGLASFWVEGADANACTFINIRIKDAYGIGILDVCYFGNVYISPQLDGSGDVRAAGEGRGRCSHNGRMWKLGKSTSLNEEPGVSEVWKDQGASGSIDTAYWPVWSAATTYQSGAGMLLEGGDATVIGGYSESLLVNSEFGSATIYGGNYAPFSHHSNMLKANANVAQAGKGLFNSTALGSYQTWQTAANRARFGNYSYVTLGGKVGLPAIMQHYDDIDQRAMTYFRGASGNYVYQNGVDGTGDAKVYQVTGVNTTATFGRSAAVPWAFYPQMLALGNPDDGNLEARLFGYADAAPTTGYHARGEFRVNQTPSAGGVVAWACSASGTPGTWIELRNYTAGAAVADATGGGTVDTECRAQLNALLARVRALGLIAT